MKRLILLGATGSIGTQTIDVVVHHRNEFSIIGLSVGYNMEKLQEILQQLPEVRCVCVAEEADAQRVQKLYPKLEVLYGEAGMKQLCERDDYDMLVNAVVGFRGLVPTLTAIHNDKDVALANKESLVAGGPLVKQALAAHNVYLYPLDSEHSAIFQCLQGNCTIEVEKMIITASGGSFRDRRREELENVTVTEALNHPNWQMGGRITIDSATMMNKGFEVIEAHYLFDIPFDKIETIIHRESIIHSMVQFQDYTIMAQLGSADMRLPIQYALTYPNRKKIYNAKPLDFSSITSLNFQTMDFERYPLLALAYEVGKKGGNAGAVMNGADEAAVQIFLQGDMPFLTIEEDVKKAVEAIEFIAEPTLEDLIESDRKAREFVFGLHS